MQIAMDFFFSRSFLIFAVKNSGKKFYATGPLCINFSSLEPKFSWWLVLSRETSKKKKKKKLQIYRQKCSVKLKLN